MEKQRPGLCEQHKPGRLLLGELFMSKIKTIGNDLHFTIEFGQKMIAQMVRWNYNKSDSGNCRKHVKMHKKQEVNL